MSSKYIVIAPCGNRSVLFKKAWRKYTGEKEFDLCLIFYDEEIKDRQLYNEADYFFHLKGFKYPMIADLLTNIKTDWINQYEYFYFLDDDIEIDTRQINRLFSLSKAFDVLMSCASLTSDSFCSWPMFKQKPGHFCRYVGQVEVMSPLFSAAALKICMPTFTFNKSSWGMDSVWAKLLGYPQNRMIVFDTVLMRHTQPVGKGDLYQKIGADPEKEWLDIITHYGAKRHNYQEFSRLYIIDESSNKLANYYFKYGERWQKKKALWKQRASNLLLRKNNG